MSDPRFSELLEKYWNAAYQQGKEGRNYDDAAGTAEGAEWDLTQYVEALRTALADERKRALEEAADRIKEFAVAMGRIAEHREANQHLAQAAIDTLVRALKEPTK